MRFAALHFWRPFLLQAVLLGAAWAAGPAQALLPPDDAIGGAMALPPDPVEMLTWTVQQDRLAAAAVRAEVEHELRQARAHAARDPWAVQQSLKLALHHVLERPELPGDLRARLRRELEVALRETARRAVTQQTTEQQVQESRAAAVDRLRVADALMRDEEKLRQLMDRFDSLMDEGRYRVAEHVAAEAEEAAPRLPVIVTASLTSQYTESRAEAAAARAARQKGVVDTLSTVETSLIPFADDQPIVYPDATRWRELTLRRRAETATDLHPPSRAEVRIRRALVEPTELDFTQTPLDEVVDYLKDLHGIEIQFDTKALEGASLGVGTPVTRKLRGISLRSALRLLLRDLDLTYLIKNEVLMITTPERAAEEVVARVYPVADLVIPPGSEIGGSSLSFSSSQAFVIGSIPVTAGSSAGNFGGGGQGGGQGLGGGIF